MPSSPPQTAALLLLALVFAPGAALAQSPPTGSFARAYDQAHLANNKDQRVTSINVSVKQSTEIEADPKACR